jgi:hypothetical protein
MKHSLGNSVLAVVLSFFLTIWFFSDGVVGIFQLNLGKDTIQRLDINVDYRKIYLNVHLKRETTCEKIIQFLDIEPITIKEKRYTPSCRVITGKLIIITYDEITDI